MVDLSKVRAGLLQINPFWGYLLAQIPVKVRKTSVGTSYTDGREIVLEETQMSDDKEAVKILLHELGHIAYMHVARAKDMAMVAGDDHIPPVVVNLGEDVIANAIVRDVVGEEIRNAGVRVPEGSKGQNAMVHIAGTWKRVEFPRAIAEMTTEEVVIAVWEAVKDILPPGGGCGGDGDGDGDGDGNGGEEGDGNGNGGGNEEKRRKMAEKNGKDGSEQVWVDDHSKHGGVSNADVDELRQKIERAVEHAEKSRGAVPAGILAVVEAMRPKVAVDWRMVVRQWVRETWGGDEYSWNRPNKRRMAVSGIYMPRIVGHSAEAWIVLDTSGSMAGTDLRKAVGAIQKGMIRNKVDVARVVQCDAQVQKVDTVRVQKLERYEVKGLGGTVLRPAVELAVKKGAKGVIVVTDGAISAEDLAGWSIPLLVMVTDQREYASLKKLVAKNVRVVCVE